MSWSLSLDRAPRMRKPTTFSDSTKYKDISNDDEGVKKKRGRPARSTQDFPSDGSTQPRKRGRPPKHSRPQTPVSDLSIRIKEEDSIKKIKSKPENRDDSTLSPNDQLSDDSDYFSYDVDYVYEYEYEYDQSDIPQEDKNSPLVEISSNENISPSRLPSAQKNPLKPLKKITKSKSASISDFIGNDDVYNSVEEILGQYNPFPFDPNQTEKYLVKFKGRAHIHCKWLTKQEINEYDGRDVFLNFQKRITGPLVQSLSIPHLLVIQDSDIPTEWFEVDRIWDSEPFPLNSSSNSERVGYWVKWKEIDYDLSTFEASEDIKDSVAIDQYKQRLQHANPKKIPRIWVHPVPSAMKPVTKRPVSKNGDVFRDYQMEGLNWLISCWHQRRNSIFGDLSRVGKLPTLICMLNYLSSQYDIHGPFLVLSSSPQILDWQQQFANWSDLNIVVLNGNLASRKIIIEHEIEARNKNNRSIQDIVKSDVVLVSYDFLLMKLPIFSEIQWRYVIADDGYKMKNASGKVPQVMKQFLTYEHITLSMEREVEIVKPKNEAHIFNLLNFIDPENYDSSKYQEFQLHFTHDESENAEKLKKIVEPYLLCRSSDEIAEQSKPKQEKIIITEPSSIQKTLYVNSIKELTPIFMKPITDQADDPLINLISRLRCLINHPMLLNYPPETFSEVGNSIVMASGKLYFIDQLLTHCIPEGKKVMIFSQLVQVLDILEAYLNEKQISFERIDSTTQPDDRDIILTRFKDQSKPTPVFIFSSKPGSYHIDLNLFDIVVVYDNDNYTFHSEMKGDLYRLITNGSYEGVRFDQSNPCFDEHTLQYLNEKDYRPMDAQDIEVIIRDTIKPMFDNTNNDYFTKSLDDLLEASAPIRIVQAKVNYNEQKQFWGEYLNAQQQLEAPEKESLDVSQVQQLIASLIDHGLTKKGGDQLDLLKCALTLNPPTDKKIQSDLFLIVGDNSSEQPLKRFSQYIFLIDNRCSKMFERVIFFRRLHRALLYSAHTNLIDWPTEDPFSEYALMYNLDSYGFKQLPSAFEEAKELKQKEIEKKAQHLINELEEQYVKFENIELPEVPLEPHIWYESYLSEEETELFEVLKNYGIPLNEQRLPAYDQLKSIGGLNHIDIGKYTDLIIEFGLSLLNSENPGHVISTTSININSLQEKYSHDDFLHLIFVCRLMNKIYSFFLDHQDLSEPSIFDNVKLSDKFPLNSSQMLKYLKCLIKNGISDVDSLSENTNFNFHGNSSEDERLRLAESIIDQIVSSHEIQAINSLKIYNFGKIIRSKNFKSQSCHYPVGFVSKRTRIESITDIQSSFKCEIHAVGNYPVFVVSKWKTDPTDESIEFVGKTPLDAWKMMISSIIGRQETEQIIQNLKLSGDWLFGLTTPFVMSTLQEMSSSSQ